MPTKDGFDPADPLPLFLTDRGRNGGIANAGDRAVTSSRIIKASILIAAATAVGIAALSAGSPVTLFADVTASSVGNSGLKLDTDQPTPTIQFVADAPALVRSTVDAQALPSTATHASNRDEIAASEPADRTEKSAPRSAALFRQFQAWAKKETQANVRPPQPVQDAPAQAAQEAPTKIVENARASRRLARKHRRVLPVRNARAEMRERKKERTTSTRSSATLGLSEAEPHDSPDIVYIDGKPCNRLCQSYMRVSRQLMPVPPHGDFGGSSPQS